MPGVLPGPRPLGAIDRQHLRVRRTLVQRDLEGIRVLLDKPRQGVPVLHGCWPRTDLVPPHLTAHLGFVHRANLGAAHPGKAPDSAPVTAGHHLTALLAAAWMGGEATPAAQPASPTSSVASRACRSTSYRWSP